MGRPRPPSLKRTRKENLVCPVKRQPGLFPFNRGLTHLTHPFSIRGDATVLSALETRAIVQQGKPREQRHSSGSGATR